MTASAVSRGTKPTLSVVPPVATFDEVLLELVDVDDNVRADVGDLEELKASVHELGILQPIKVTAQPDGRYRVVWGQRRVLACRELGRLRIPAIVEPPSDVDRHGARRSIEQLSENLQRKDLNPIEEAVALREVLDTTKGLTQEALADKLGMSRPWVSNTLGLLDASPAVQTHVREGRLTPSHVKALRGLAPKTQDEIAKVAVSEGTSAHGVESLVQQHKRNEEWKKDREKQSRRDQEAKVAAAATSLERLTKYKVPLDAAIVVTGYYDKAAAAGATKKAGFTNVKTTGEIRPRTSAVDCDCEAWKGEPHWTGGVSVSKGCVKPAHVAAKSQLSDHLDNERRQLATRSREALKARLLEECRGIPRMLARVVLWRSLDWGVNDWVRDHKPAGKKPNAWEELTALTDEQLAAELAEHLAKRFQDQNGIKLDWTLIAAELGVTAEKAPVDG